MPYNVNGQILSDLQVKYYNATSPVRSGMVIYLDANMYASYSGGTTWYDLSGNGNNFTWGSTPTYSTEMGARYFATSGNRATGPASNSVGINNSSGYSILFISQTNTNNANSAFKFYGSDAYGRGIFAHPGWSNYTMYFDQGGCCDANQRTQITVDSTDFTRFRLWALTSNAVNKRKIYKNGVVVAENSTAPANIDLNSTAIDLGSSDEYGGASSNWNGKLNIFLVYNRALTDAEVLQNYQYFRMRFERYHDCGYGCTLYDYDPGCTDCYETKAYSISTGYDPPNYCNGLSGPYTTTVYGNALNIQYVDRFYTDAAMTTAFNGAGKYYGESSGYAGTTWQISSDGYVIGSYAC